MAKVPKDVLVVIDEAYYEYVTNKDYPNTLSLLKEHENIIILRTFSKAYGLASLRVGYGIANKELIQNLEKVRNPFNVTSIGMELAKVALEDRKFVQDTVIKNRKVLEYVYSELDKRQIEYIESNANFVFINTKKDANEVFAKLLQKGIIVRPGFPKMESYIRVTIGTREEMEEFIKKIELIKKEN